MKITPNDPPRTLTAAEIEAIFNDLEGSIRETRSPKYARTADSTADVWLSKLLNELSADEYRHAERLMSLLERSLRQQGSC